MAQLRPEAVVAEIWPLEQADLEQGMETVAWEDPHQTNGGRIAEMELEEPIQYYADSADAASILEIGSSSGATTEELSALVPSAEITGVELSDDYVRAAERRRDSTEPCRWHVVQGRATELPDTVDGQYDMVVALNSLSTLVGTGAVGEAALISARDIGYEIPDAVDGENEHIGFTDGLQDAANHRYVADVLDSVSTVSASGAPFLLADGCCYLVAEHRDGDWYVVESRDAVLERRQPGGSVQRNTYAAAEEHKRADDVYRVWLDHMDMGERSRQVPVQIGV